MSLDYRKMVVFQRGNTEPAKWPENIVQSQDFVVSYFFKCRKVFSNSLTLCQDTALQIFF